MIKDDARFDLTLWLGQVDLLQNVLGDSTGRTAFKDVAELRAAGRRIGDYVQAHVDAQVDGHPVQPQDWRGWPPRCSPLRRTCPARSRRRSRARPACR